MPYANAVARAVEDYELRGIAMPAPTSGRIMRLYKQSGPPTADGTGTEADYPGYARQSLASTTAVWGPAGTVPSVKAPVEFPGPTTAGPHDDIGHIVITDSTGIWRLYATMVQPITPQQGQPITFTVDDIVFDANG